jgi:hypothetical protein
LWVWSLKILKRGGLLNTSNGWTCILEGRYLGYIRTTSQTIVSSSDEQLF